SLGGLYQPPRRRPRSGQPPEGGLFMSHARRDCIGNETPRNGQAPIRLDLKVRDPTVIDYLARFKEEDRPERALDALKVGAIALRWASPALDAEEVARQVERQIGPGSDLAKALDPSNKNGVVARIEDRVQGVVEETLKPVLGEFSLDREGSAL